MMSTQTSSDKPRKLDWRLYRVIGVIVAIVILPIIVVVGVFWLLSFISWPDWTGFNPKTLWDVLDLLIGPLIVSGIIAGVTYRWNAQQKEREQLIARDKGEEAALQTYIDQMSDLLLKHQLRGKAEEKDTEERSVARVRTLMVLGSLTRRYPPLHTPDANELPESDVLLRRKALVLQFLYESRLIMKDAPIVGLEDADLSRANLDDAKLANACLARADLVKAYLSHADLTNADLAGASLLYASLVATNLTGANLTGAYLTGADLTEANLTDANLEGAHISADLTEANLTGANLTGASLWGNLTKANLTGANLTGANLYDATLTDAILTNAQWNGETIWPKGFQLPGNTAKADATIDVGIAK